MALKFFKVTTLPGSLEADALYFVNNGAYAETYLTSNAGVAKSLGNTAMIQSVSQAVVDAAIASAAANPVEVVADIAARNTLTGAALTNKLILVKNAVGDATVTAGAALYVFEKTGNTTTKIAEYEGMDVVLQWANIQGKPSSAASLIDDAVTKRHTHANITVLDKLGDASGALTYDGSVVGTNWSTNNW